MIQATLLDAMAPSGWPTFAVVSARVAGMVLAGPVFSMATIPARIRAAFAVALTLTLVPTVPAVGPLASDLSLPLVMGSELLIGIAVGLAVALFAHAVSLGGEVVGVQMGLHIASAIDPTLETTEGDVGRLGNLMVLALYLALGGHLVAIRGLAHSFDVIRPAGQADIAAGFASLIPFVSTVFSTAVSIAAPVMVAVFLANIALAVLNRAVPQIATFMVAFPFTIGLGLVVLAASLPVRATHTARWVQGLPEFISHTVGSFVPAPETR